jgi:arginase
MTDTTTARGTATAGSDWAVTHFAGRAGDHNDRAMAVSGALAAAFADHLATDAVVIGTPEPALSADWAIELDAARPALRQMADRLDTVLTAGRVPVTASSRCAVALATLPVVARHRPEGVVVWFDAHPDLNTPQDTTTGYLGGLALSAPLGLWDSGLGAGLPTSHAVLVGARDVDAPEQQLLDDGTIALVPVGPVVADEMRRVLAGRPVYVHIDCDVLEPDTVPTDYRVPGGLTLDQLHECATALAESEVVGVEVGELETSGDLETDRENAGRLLDALAPLLRTERHAG